MKNQKLIRQGWGREGANVGSLYVGKLPSSDGVIERPNGRSRVLPAIESQPAVAFDLKGRRISAFASYTGAHIEVVKYLTCKKIQIVIR
jgi:hypothetical protein